MCIICLHSGVDNHSIILLKEFSANLVTDCHVSPSQLMLSGNINKIMSKWLQTMRINSKPSTYYRCRIPFTILGIWIIEGRLTCTIYVRQRLIILVLAYKSLHRGPTNHFKQPHSLPPIPFNSLLPSIFTYFTKYDIDSERSEECIDFTMIISSRNNAPISNYGGGFRCKSEYPWYIIEVKIFKKIEKNKKKKMTEKREFLRKTSFRPNRIFFMVCR
ncbi:Uncharacterized protein FWK35_00018973 [Aphis craccivora]|uniref:Uncharacterized protein n=1 Tax=Aphis craccivora TaxID=307492 RepID=A0A6G0Y8U8_APHCR|nr:Uncharacterized protein FWK35_00018973 [Aphis craccivora]